MRVGILGGTGSAGRALAARLASAGYETIVGSRSVERAVDTCRELQTKWPDHNLNLCGESNSGAAACDVVMVATPWDAAASTVAALADEVAGKVVISIANAMKKVGGQFQQVVLTHGSVAAEVQAAAPQAFVVATLHHVSAHDLGNLNQPLDCDVLVCGDHLEAKATTMTIIDSFPGAQAIDAGALSHAITLEAFTAVMLQINVAYKSRVALRLRGLNTKQG